MLYRECKLSVMRRLCARVKVNNIEVDLEESPLSSFTKSD